MFGVLLTGFACNLQAISLDVIPSQPDICPSTAIAWDNVCVSITSISRLTSGADLCACLKKFQTSFFNMQMWKETPLQPIDLQRTCNWSVDIHSSIVYSMNEYLAVKTWFQRVCNIVCFLPSGVTSEKALLCSKNTFLLKRLHYCFRQSFAPPVEVKKRERETVICCYI